MQAIQSDDGLGFLSLGSALALLCITVSFVVLLIAVTVAFVISRKTADIPGINFIHISK